MGEKHSAVGYLFREGAFLPAQETKPVRNEFGLDLFQHRGSVYEGKTGLQFCSLQQAEDLAGFVEKHGGIEKVQKLIADSLERTGLSPRYTRPDEKKKDIFPPKEKDENRVFAKDLMGNKHYYYRFYNENGIERSQYEESNFERIRCRRHDWRPFLFWLVSQPPRRQLSKSTCLEGGEAICQ